MIWLSLVSFVVAFLVAAVIIRWLGKRVVKYEEAKPQRFHVGEVPRLGGIALLAGAACAR